MIFDKSAVFLLKWGALVLIVILLLNALFAENNIQIAAGLYSGFLISSVRLVLNASMFSKMLGIKGSGAPGARAAARPGILRFITAQAVVLIVLALILNFSIKMFFGTVAGMLIFTFVIMIDAVIGFIKGLKNLE